MDQETKHSFGGKWTEEKLDCLEKYLKSYLQVLKNQKFTKVYIDAFSGTGARYSRQSSSTAANPIIPELSAELLELTEDQVGFFDGSVLRALRLDPGFDHFALIEKDPQKAAELQKIKVLHDEPGRSIHVYLGDANEQIQRICREADWTGMRKGTKTRAVLFLDPYGCQVDWHTLVDVAATGAIDLWYLFPSGLGIYRMLTKQKSGMMEGWERRLDQCLGTEEWRSAFFAEHTTTDLFGNTNIDQRKIATIDTVERFFVSRLKTIFPHVAEACLPLRNSTGYKMFSLCFASANAGRGGEHAVRIASHLLSERRRLGR